METKETSRVMIPGRGARECILKIGTRAIPTETLIKQKAILLPFLKSMNTIRIQQSELIAAIMPWAETTGIVKLPKVIILEYILGSEEIKYIQKIEAAVEIVSSRDLR